MYQPAVKQAGGWLDFKRDGLADGLTNMALDCAMLRRAEVGSTCCRLYGWDGPWVSLGRFQAASEAVISGFRQVVTRPTGGKAVLHGHDQTVAFAAPFSGRSVKSAYLHAVQPVLEALEWCGVECVLAADRSFTDLRSEACFASASPYDILERKTGQKFAGAAMRITRSGLLLQVSIPSAAPLVSPSSVIRDAVDLSPLAWNWQSFPSALETVLR